MKDRILLTNGCWFSMPKLCPKSASGKNASTAKPWSIQYRFYDPAITDQKGNPIPKQVILKGMNNYQDVAERRAVSKRLIQNELDLLQEQGYNPHTKQFIVVQEQFYEIAPNTPFIKALWSAYEKTEFIP